MWHLFAQVETDGHHANVDPLTSALQVTKDLGSSGCHAIMRGAGINVNVVLNNRRRRFSPP